MFSQWLELLNIGSKNDKGVSWAVEIKGKVNYVDKNVDNREFTHDLPLIVNAKIDDVIPEIEWDDIEEEVNFWEPFVSCYVLGANPPFNVVKGFIRRIWGRKVIDRIIPVGHGLFIVRLRI